MPYNVRATIGRNKGKFTKKSTDARLQPFLNVVKGKRGARRKVENTLDNKDIKLKRFDGHRIMDMNKIADDMWCTICDNPLSFRFLVDEQQIGIASNCSIQCHICKNFYQIETSLRYFKNNYDSNSKLTKALLDAELDKSKVNMILSALNIPTITDTLLKDCKRCCGSETEAELEQKLFMDAIKLEKT